MISLPYNIAIYGSHYNFRHALSSNRPFSDYAHTILLWLLLLSLCQKFSRCCYVCLVRGQKSKKKKFWPKHFEFLQRRKQQQQKFSWASQKLHSIRMYNVQCAVQCTWIKLPPLIFCYIRISLTKCSTCRTILTYGMNRKKKMWRRRSKNTLHKNKISRVIVETQLSPLKLNMV